MRALSQAGCIATLFSFNRGFANGFDLLAGAKLKNDVGEEFTWEYWDYWDYFGLGSGAERRSKARRGLDFREVWVQMQVNVVLYATSDSVVNPPKSEVNKQRETTTGRFSRIDR